MSCSKCGQPEGSCNYECEEICIEATCCPPPEVKRNICEIAVAVDCCDPRDVGDDLNGNNSCPCVPCPEDISFTPEQIAYLEKAKQGLIATLIPQQVCGCEIQNSIGHAFPIAPSADQLIERTDEDGNGTGLFDLAPDAGCCGPFPLKHSMFRTRGNFQARYNRHGGRASGHGGIDSITGGSREGMDALMKLICCTFDTVISGEPIEMVEMNEEDAAAPAAAGPVVTPEPAPEVVPVP